MSIITIEIMFDLGWSSALIASFTLLQSWFHVLIVRFCFDVAVILLCSGHFLVVCFLITTVLGDFSLW